MADSQPPEGLQPKIAPFATDDVDAAVTALANNAYLGEEGPLDRDDMEEIARLVLSSASARGRLLPSGGEVSTQKMWPRFGESTIGTRKVITWPDGSYYMGPVVPDPPLSPEAIQAVRDRLRAIQGPWSPALSDNSEASDGD